MILLDTNLLSEPWRPAPDRNVVAWLDAQAIETLYLSAISIAEIRFGIAAMAAGRRQASFHDRLESALLPLFAGRILPFDVETTRLYADLMVRARAAGKAIGLADGYIAATALQNGLAVATRDVQPFQAAGLDVINPWLAAS